MDFVHRSNRDGIATLTLRRGKVNALNEDLVDQLHGALADLEDDPGTRAVILTGNGKFFSFGFDIPEFLPHSREDFRRYVLKFTDLYTYAFAYPKPLVAALNGHTIAGGCMLAITCDHRLMVSGKAKIALNEMGFGSTVFAGSVEMLRFCVGDANSARILYSGALYSAEEAKALGLVDTVVSGGELESAARTVATELAGKPGPAFTSIKSMLRRPVAEAMHSREQESIAEFLDIWYSEGTRENLKDIKIY
jgi:enoyl-CoA hydratase/carnithine racemase